MTESTVQNGFDDNNSVWTARKPPYEPLPKLEEDITCDVAIIGGGFCGVSTALHMAERAPEKSIVLLEARTLGNGASGRNGGLVLNWVNGVESNPPEYAKLVYDATREGIDLIERVIRDYKLPPLLRREGTFEVLTDPARAEGAEKAVERLNSVGIPLQYLHGDRMLAHLGLQGAFGAVFDPTTGQLDGLGYLRALRPVLLEHGVRVFENTTVLSIEEGKTIALRTPHGQVKAGAIVLATNAYTPNLGYFRHGIVPLHSHAIGTERLSPEEWHEIGWRKGAGFSDDLDRIAYASLTKDGELVFGGGSNAAYTYVYGSKSSFHGEAEANFRAVHERLLKYLPKAKKVKIAHRWTGAVAITMSRICTMGVLGEHRNVYFGVGFSGHGITLANLAGRVLTDIYSGADERWRKLPFYQQKLLYIPSDPWRWLGYHVFTTVTGKSPRRAM
jgi:glycine/D-amino acid oxidase-like deaminating enzyme